jgi:hypothetical protein
MCLRSHIINGLLTSFCSVCTGKYLPSVYPHWDLAPSSLGLYENLMQANTFPYRRTSLSVNNPLIKTTITCRNRENSSQEFFAETWPKTVTFLAKCVFLMANNLEKELNIDGILLEICSTCVCCPGQSINIWFLSDTVRQRSSSNFSMWRVVC